MHNIVKHTNQYCEILYNIGKYSSDTSIFVRIVQYFVLIFYYHNKFLFIYKFRNNILCQYF